MAGIVLLFGKLSFAAVGIAVGVKLAASAREDGLGLHTVALAAICVGGIGMLAMPAGKPLDSVALVVMGELAIRVAMLLLCVFIAGTFRPSPAGVAGACACAALLLWTLVWDLTGQPSLIHYDYTRLSSHANQLAVAAPFAWSCAESALLWSRSRRRLVLGLSEPAVVQRYLLWSITTGCFVAIALLAVASGLALSGGSVAAADLGQALRGVLYLVITAGVWFGIFSTRLYQESTATADAEPA